MALFLTQTFQKHFRKLPKNIQTNVENSMRKIYSDPYKEKKLLGELEGEFSYRLGKYRIIYFIDREKNIWIETVRHRKDVYKKK